VVACEDKFSEDRGVKEGQQNGGMHTVELLEDALNSTRTSATAHSNVELVCVRHVIGIEVKSEKFGKVE
jgi:hypothetical protein